MDLILTLIILAVPAVVIWAFYMGWLRFSSGNGAGKATIGLSLDKGKIAADGHKLADAVNKPDEGK